MGWQCVSNILTLISSFFFTSCLCLWEAGLFLPSYFVGFPMFDFFFFSIFNKIRTINLKKESCSFQHVFVAEMMFTDEFTESENFRW